MVLIYRPDPKRSRFVLLLAALGIVAGEIAASILIDFAPLEIRFPEAATVVRSAQLLDGTEKILFFGSSRFRADLSAPTVNAALRDGANHRSFSAFNAAVTAGDPVAFKFLADKLLAAGVRPAAVVIEVLPETISRRNAWLRFHLARQFHWLDVWKSIPDAWRSGELAHLLSSRVVPLYFFRSEFQRWAYRKLKLNLKAAKLQKNETSATTASVQTNIDQLELASLRAATARKRLRHFKIGGLAAESLEKLAMRYRELGTRVVLIAVPVPSEYRAAYSPPVNDAFLRYMQQLRDKYVVEFFDYRDCLPDGLFHARYYATAVGQTHFSEGIAREILIPLFASGSAHTC